MFDNSRRSYFKSFLAEAISIVEELSGKPQLLLDDLERVPEDVMRSMVPVFNMARPSMIEDGWLLVREIKNGEFTRYHELQGHEGSILECFDGNHSISGVCNHLEAEFQLPPDVAFSLVKDVFVKLSKVALCHPAGGSP